MIHRMLILLLLGASYLSVSLSLRAQQSSPSNSLTNTQKEGRRIFQQRCAVCHTPPTVISKRYGPALYKEIVEDNEDNIRDTILQGRDSLMPGFKYGMERSEVDAIVEYLKTVKRPSRTNNNRPSGDSGANSGDNAGPGMN